VSLVESRFAEGPPAISPDGHWLAYSSDESGRDEVYVVPFPNTTGAKWAISSQGGKEPVWSHTGRELFFRDGAGNLVAVEIRTTPKFSIGSSDVLFAAAGFRSGITQAQYAVSPDDRRFLMIRPFAGTTSEQLIAVENWAEDLKEKGRR
jgi:Tol biopolymer transport system component